MRPTHSPMRLVACVALLLTTACYATKSVRPEDFRSLGGNLRDTQSLPTPSQGTAMVEAESLVRLNSVDQGSSDWIPANDLFVSKHAIYFESGIASSDIAAATVSNLKPEQVDRLREMAPSGGTITSEADPLGETYRLTVSAPKALLPWIGRFVTEQRERDASEGLWHLERRKSTSSWRGQGKPASFSASFDTIKGRLTGDEPLFVANGVPWSKVESVDINYLDPVVSALAVPLFPLALMSSDGREKSGNLFELATAPRRVWRADESAVEPLFAWQGKRRAIVKLVGGFDGGVEYGGSFYSSVTLGLRLRNMFEFSFILRELSKAASANESRQSYTLTGMSVGLHIDGDGDPSFAFYVGAEGLGYLGGGGSEMSFVFGPRFGLKNGLFVMVVPLSTTSLCRTDAHGLCIGGPSGIYSSIQLGLAY